MATDFLLRAQVRGLQRAGEHAAALYPMPVVAAKLSGHSPGFLDRAAALGDRLREHAYSLVGRSCGHEAETATGIAGGGASAGLATKAIVAACIGGSAAAGVGGACVATGVVDLPGSENKPVAEKTVPEEPTATAPTATTAEPTPTTPATDPQPSEQVTTTAETPVQQRSSELYGGGSSTSFRGIQREQRLRRPRDQLQRREWGRRRQRQQGELRAMTIKEETMCAIANQRRLKGLTLRHVALIALAVTSIAIMGMGASSAWGASSYQVHECNGGDEHIRSRCRVLGQRQRQQLGHERDPGLGRLRGWWEGRRPAPDTYNPGPRFARVSFDAPPTTYFDQGSFRYNIGARYPCSNGNCWSAGAHVGIWVGGMQSAPTYGGVETWGPGCGTFCSHFHIDESCESTCIHFASDPSGNANEWYYDFIAIRDIDLTAIDTEPPALSLGGSLFANQVAHGTPGLRIDATDRGSGVEAVTVDVNGVRVATPPASCPGLAGDYATRFRPCSDFHQTVGLDTTKTPWRDGQNTLRVCASDVATGPGVANQVCEQRAVSVDNTCQDSQGATGQAQSITAGLEDPQTGQLRRSRTVRSSAPAALRGQLTGAGGPVKAASVCVYETVDEPAGIEQLLQVAKSSSTGTSGSSCPAAPAAPSGSPTATTTARSSRRACTWTPRCCPPSR